jgi:hypothetical protein
MDSLPYNDKELMMRLIDSITVRHNMLWKYCGNVLAGVALWIGIGYAVGGNKTAVGPSYHLLKQIPAGMRLHGAIMLTLACMLLFVLNRKAPYDKFTMWVLRLFTFYGFLIGQGMVLYPPGIIYRKVEKK